MTSKISELKEEDGKMTFTISNIDVSYVNAMRRTILSDIPIVVFKTTPYEENKANIIINTSRYHLMNYNHIYIIVNADYG